MNKLVNIICISKLFPDEYNRLYQFFRALFKDNITKDVTARSSRMTAEVSGKTIQIIFMSSQQDIEFFLGLPQVDIVLIDTKISKELKQLLRTKLLVKNGMLFEGVNE